MSKITEIINGIAFDVILFLKNLLKTFLSLLVSFGILSGSLSFISPQEIVTSEYFMQGDETFATSAAANNYWSVGFSKIVVTPTDVLTNADKYYLAGYGNNTHPAEVMDDTYVRTVYMDDNSGRGGVIFAVIDAIGLTNKEVLEIRAMVAEFAHANNIKSVNVLCTHDHAGIDTQGLWGNIALIQSGRNEQYNTYLRNWLPILSMQHLLTVPKANYCGAIFCPNMICSATIANPMFMKKQLPESAFHL